MSIHTDIFTTLIDGFHPKVRGDVRAFLEAKTRDAAKGLARASDYSKPTPGHGLQAKRMVWEATQDNRFNLNSTKINKKRKPKYNPQITETIADPIRVETILFPSELTLTDKIICQNADKAAMYNSKNTRAGDPAWHRRKMRKHARQAVATWLYKAKATKNYTTDFSRFLSKEQEERNEKILQNRYIEFNDGKGGTEKITIAEIAKKGLENLHAENFALCKDMVKLAQEKGWKPYFITLTCAGYRRERTPSENHEFLQQQWSRMRAYLNKLDIKAGPDYMGMRCEEPHKDQTPHRHLVIFCSNIVWGEMKDAFLKYFLNADEPDERGAQKYRVKFDEPETQDWEKAINYCMKYTFKNTNNLEASQFEESNSTATSCRAWRQDWSIRAFQFFGVGTKSLYRWCNKKAYSSDINIPIVRAAQSGDWVKFIEEFYKVKHTIKSIKEEYTNKYLEVVKKCIGYKVDDVIATIKVINYDVKQTLKKTIVTVKTTEPRKSQAWSKPEIPVPIPVFISV